MLQEWHGDGEGWVQPSLGSCRELSVGAPTYQLHNSDLQSSTSTAGYRKSESSRLNPLERAGGKGKPMGLAGWACAWAAPGWVMLLGLRAITGRESWLCAAVGAVPVAQPRGTALLGHSPWHTAQPGTGSAPPVARGRAVRLCGSAS